MSSVATTPSWIYDDNYNKRYRLTVIGYVRIAQQLLPAINNPFCIISDPIINMIAEFYHLADFSCKQDANGNIKIGKWYIKETTKHDNDKFTWMKKGVDINNGKIVILKFTKHKQNDNHNIPPQIQNEINILHRIGKSENIICSYGYALNQKYSDKSGNNHNVTLLALEYTPYGQLSNLFYHQCTMESLLARTYFQQLCNGVQYLHDAGILHCDIKIPNLLLDSSYKLKITGLEYAKYVGNSNNQQIEDIFVDDYKIGTRGYQAPEIIAKQAYNNSIDIFAMGVVLFILLSGYPPFETAKTDDKWYKFIVQKNYKKFWRSHRNCGLKIAETDLITRMIVYNYKKRITINKMKKHQWYTAKVLNDDELIDILSYRRQCMELKQHAEIKNSKLLILAKYNGCRCLHHNPFINPKKKPPKLPDNIRASLFDVYTTKKADIVLNAIKKIIDGCRSRHSEVGNIQSSTYNRIFDDDDFVCGEIDVDNFGLSFKISFWGPEMCNLIVHVQVYYVPKHGCNLVRFNIVSDKKQIFVQVRRMILTKAPYELTGLPSDQRIQPNDQTLQLYKECFRH